MKQMLKTLLEALAWLFVAPLAYPVKWLGGVDSRHLIFQFGSHIASQWPGLPGVYLRRAYYRIVLGLRSKGFVIEFGAILCQRGIEIGNGVYVGPYCNIGLSILEDDVLLGSNVDIVSGKQTHYFDRLDVPIRDQGGVLKKIRIGKGAWIGNKAVVMESLGDGAIVGAGSVVTSEVDTLLIVGGNPARVLRSRKDQGKSESTRVEEQKTT